MATANEVTSGVKNIQALFELLNDDSRKDPQSKESTDNVEKDDNEILEFILDLCSDVDGRGEAEKTTFATIMNWFLPIFLRIAIDAFIKKIKEYYLCNTDGAIPSWLATGELRISMDTVDSEGIFKNDPKSIMGILFFSNPFHKFLYYEVLTKPGNVATWPDNLYLENEVLLNTTTNASGVTHTMGNINYKLFDFRYDRFTNDLIVRLNVDVTNIVEGTDMTFFDVVKMYFESIGKNNGIYKEIQRFKAIRDKLDSGEITFFRSPEDNKDFVIDPMTILLYFFYLFYGMAARQFNNDRDSLYREQESLMMINKMLSVDDVEWCFIDDSFFDFTDDELTELEQIVNERYSESFIASLGCGDIRSVMPIEDAITAAVNITTCPDADPTQGNIDNMTDEEYIYSFDSVEQNCPQLVVDEMKKLGSVTLSADNNDEISEEDKEQLSKNIMRGFIKNLVATFAALTIKSPSVKIIFFVIQSIADSGTAIKEMNNKEFLRKNASFWWDYLSCLKVEIRKFLFRQLINKLAKMIPFIIAELLKKKQAKELQILLTLFGCLNNQFDLVKKLNDAV